MATFADYSLDPSILLALDKMGIEKPSPIQEKTLPLILEGKDVIGIAETGSGKTAACAIPVCQKIDVNLREIQALIVVPTRELCRQYAMETEKIGSKKRVKTLAVFGGQDIRRQLTKLKRGVQVLVATPGRLVDFIRRRKIDLSMVSTFVLDEADEMVSMGFEEDLEYIMDSMEQEHQTLLISATMNEEVNRIADERMKSPERIVLTSKQKTPAKIAHKFLYVGDRKKRTEALVDQLDIEELNQCLIFCEARIQTERLCRDLKGRIENIDFLHGGLRQNIRTRIIDKFRKGKTKHLVVTDVAARGLDFSGVTHVFIYELGRDSNTYLHRTGRTGRVGREGVAISLVTPHERALVKKVFKEVNGTWIGTPMPSGKAPKFGPKKFGGRKFGKKKPNRSARSFAGPKKAKKGAFAGASRGPKRGQRRRAATR